MKLKKIVVKIKRKQSNICFLNLEVINGEAKLTGDNLRAERKNLSGEIGNLMKNGKKDEAEEIKKKVNELNEKLETNEALENEYAEKIKEIMKKIPNIIHESVPIGKDDTENVEVKRYGEPIVPNYEIPYHGEIMEKFV